MLFSFQGTFDSRSATHGGDDGDRTRYLLLARQALSQLSKSPIEREVQLIYVLMELPTTRYGLYLRETHN